MRRYDCTMVRTAIASLVLGLSTLAHADFRTTGLDALKTIDQRAGRSDGLFAERLRGGMSRRAEGPSTAWAAGVQLSALNAAAMLDKAWVKRANDYAVALDKYRGIDKISGLISYQPFPGPNGGDIYYDDNQWLVIGFVDTFKLTGDREHLRRAVDAYNFSASGESDVLGGGIFWRADEKTSKNTCSNAPAAVAALYLYDVTKERKYLDDAKRLRDWTTQNLQDKDGLFFDNIQLDKKIGDMKWTYNSALMIRANVGLYEVTKEQRYLDEAIRIADSSEKKWFRESDGAMTDESAFAHLMCEALLDLDRVAPRPERVAKIDRALKFLQKLNRNGAYPHRFDGWKPNERSTQLLTQASVARAFLFAAHAIKQ